MYMYQEGLVRFATEEYSNNKKIFGNPYIHLTNYSINKKNKEMEYGKNMIIKTEDETKTKWTFKKFRKYLIDSKIPHESLFNKIEDLIIKTILSIEHLIFTAHS